jgi:tetratricopeptide (TPR) repeat protein
VQKYLQDPLADALLRGDIRDGETVSVDEGEGNLRLRTGGRARLDLRRRKLPGHAPMKALDVNSLFARAEQHFAAGRPDAARGDLAQVQRLSGDHPAVLHLLALVEKKRGDLVAARAAFERALRLAPRDQKILNNYANLLDSMGKPELALSQYDRALAVDSGFRDARLNRALLLQRLGRREEALAELDRLAAAYASSARFHSARGAVLRELGRLDDAAAAFDRALALEPHRLLALHGRARVAIERGNDDASSWYRRALAVKPDDTGASARSRRGSGSRRQFRRCRLPGSGCRAPGGLD